MLAGAVKAAAAAAKASKSSSGGSSSSSFSGFFRFERILVLRLVRRFDGGNRQGRQLLYRLGQGQKFCKFCGCRFYHERLGRLDMDQEQ